MNKKLLASIIFIIFILLIINAGCLNKTSCGYSHTGIGLSASFKISENEKVYLNDYLSSQYYFLFSYNNTTFSKYQMKIRTNISSQIYFDYPIISGNYKYKKNEWNTFYFGLLIVSNNSFIENKTFFNNSNIIKGKILINNENRIQIELIKPNSYIEVTDNSKSSQINVNMNGWFINLNLINAINCP